VLPDFARLEEKSKGKLRIIPTGKVKPAIKRNMGMKKAKGNIYASIDSDAYPDQDWLKNGIKYFQNEHIGLVGGPNLTPKNANFAEQIGGEILSEPIASGFAAVRYRKAKNRYVTIYVPNPSSAVLGSPIEFLNRLNTKTRKII